MTVRLLTFISVSCVVFFLAMALTVYDLRWTHKRDKEALKKRAIQQGDEIQILQAKLGIAEQEADRAFIQNEILQAKVDLLSNATNADKLRWAKIAEVNKEIRDTMRMSYLPPGCSSHPSSKDILTTAGAMVDASMQYDVELSLMMAMAKRESLFHNCARSEAGARGIMQLMPRTARYMSTEIGRNMKTNRIRDNVFMGTYYLSDLLIEFEGDTELAVKSYNAGPEHVRRVMAGERKTYYEETAEYWKAIEEYKKEYERIGL
jgi:soluble lytic murein transglycosylase-like protein